MDDTTGYGRIYGVTPKNKKLGRPTIDMATTDGQLTALMNPAIHVRFEAHQKLTTNGASIIPQVKEILQDPNPFHGARAIWLLAGLGDEGKKEVEKLLGHRDEGIRAVAFRALRQHSADIVGYARQLAEDPSPFVKREIILGLADYPYLIKKPIFLQLLKSFDANDRWYIEALGNAVSGHEDDFIHEARKLLDTANAKPDEWNENLEMLVWRLHPTDYVDQLKSRAQSDKLSELQRQRAVTALAFINSRQAVKAMLELSGNSNKEIAEQATYWVSFRQSNDWYTLADWSKVSIDPAKERKIAEMKVKRNYVLDAGMPFYEKRRSARDMARDVIGSNMLLALVAAEQFPKDLYDEVSDLMLNHPDQTIRIQASQYFSSVAEHRYDIPSIAALSSDPAKGKLIFKNKCSSCHRVGDNGMDIGPELTQIKKKFDKQAMMDAIVNPSSGIVFGYEAWTIQTNDGQSHFGFLVADGKEAVVIKDLSGARHVIQVKDIASRQKSEKSLMPEASGLALNNQELADVVGYLNNLK